MPADILSAVGLVGGALKAYYAQKLYEANQKFETQFNNRLASNRPVTWRSLYGWRGYSLVDSGLAYKHIKPEFQTQVRHL